MGGDGDSKLREDSMTNAKGTQLNIGDETNSDTFAAGKVDYAYDAASVAAYSDASAQNPASSGTSPRIGSSGINLDALPDDMLIGGDGFVFDTENRNSIDADINSATHSTAGLQNPAETPTPMRFENPGSVFPSAPEQATDAPTAEANGQLPALADASSATSASPPSQKEKGAAKHRKHGDKDTEGKPARRQRRTFSSLSYISQVILCFAFISASTALIAIGVISIVWNQYFQLYTAENMATLAETTSNRISSAYLQYGGFYDEVLDAARQAAETSNEVGIRVLNNNSEILFDSTDRFATDTATDLEPDSATQVAISNITVGDSVIGSVRVWIYGSDTLMNHLDEQFRDNTYKALLIAAAVAVIIASLIGFIFARTLVSPINRVTRAAEALSKGDYSARTDMSGDDEISQLGNTLDEMARSIERDRELERRLTSDVAHELRTPLMAIQATVEAMIDGVYDTDEEHLMLIDSEVRRLSRLVDALLKLSRLENRTQPFKEEVLNLGKLIEGIVISHEVLVVDSGLSIEYHAEPNVRVVGDPDKISQAVANLISNAVRYTSEGGSILVDVRREGQIAAIDVSDTGVGLTPEEEQMVFSRFWRADAGRNRESGGLGIGLAVVKEIVDRHGGRVLVHGEKGIGSTFTIVLPLYNESQSMDSARKAMRSKAAGTRL